MLDLRYLAVALIIGTFMSVTVGHVANYAGSFEAAGWTWLGWPYAVAVDAAIVVCAWLTRWKTTRTFAVAGYIVFALASGAMNAAAIKPWQEPGLEAVFAWVYSIFPTTAIVLLGLLARDTEQVAEHGKARGLFAQWSRLVAQRLAQQEPSKAEQAESKPERKAEQPMPFECLICGRSFATQKALNGHMNAHRTEGTNGNKVYQELTEAR